MLISKNDCMEALVQLEDKGKNIDKYMTQLLLAKDTIPVKVLQFIAQNNCIAVTDFYTVLRHSYNRKRSPLYGNLVKENIKAEEIPVVLSSLITQIYLYAKHIENPARFYTDARLSEALDALMKLTVAGDHTYAEKILRALRTDILVSEYLLGQRQLEES